MGMDFRIIHWSLCLAYWVLVGITIAGCAAKEPPTPPPTPPTARAPQADPVSYGGVTANVRKGVTTQSDLLHLFGGPNIATTDSDGTETWVYERSASESETITQSKDESAKQSSAGDVQKLKEFFGGTRTTHSIRTVTVIIKFNQNKTVRDFSVRASTF
jgi:outer membrane protein assembly factor BamE (lipoprotein component of BamABCDE complex)